MKEIRTRIAGIHYHKGNVSGLKAGDHLLLIREPQSRYDGNAIKVETLDGTKLGYIPKELALSLAHEMDTGQLAYAVIESTRNGCAAVRPKVARETRRLLKHGAPPVPPECQITVRIGAPDEISLPARIPKPTIPARAPTPTPAPAPVEVTPPRKSFLGSLWRSLFG